MNYKEDENLQEPVYTTGEILLMLIIGAIILYGLYKGARHLLKPAVENAATNSHNLLLQSPEIAASTLSTVDIASLLKS